MREGQTQFPYLLITDHPEVMVIISSVSVDRQFVGDAGIYSFWTEKPYDELFSAFSAEQKGFALVQVEEVRYNFADGKLSGIMAHIN